MENIDELDNFQKKYEVTWLAEIKTTFLFTVGGALLCGILFFSLHFTRRLTRTTSTYPRFEKIFDASVDSKTCEANLKTLAKYPHLAGTKAGEEVGEFLAKKLKTLLGNSEHVTVYNETYEVLLPFPTAESYLNIENTQTNEKIHAKLYESPIVAATPEKEGSEEEGDDIKATPYAYWNKSFIAYSANGKVDTDTFFYVNYGTVEDFEVIKKRGISLNGKVVIARYGKIFRGQKVKSAQEAGASGVILYSDPADDGANVGKTFPEGPWRPEDALQRGSTMFLAEQPGDPTTPGNPSLPGTRHRISRDQATNLPKIPVIAISAKEALKFMSRLNGAEVEDAWKGGLSATYRYGADDNVWQINLNVKNDEKITQISNIIAKIEGEVEPDRSVMLGNHRDAWAKGATDPHSGSIVLLEVAKGLGELVAAGWRPRRTVLLAFWDAEEQGLIGSTEYVEQYAAQLKQQMVAYINVDTYQGDAFRLIGSGSLGKVVNEAAVGLELKPNATTLEGTTSEDIVPALVGSGSDYTAFYHHAGIPILDLSFRQSNGKTYGTYHSIHDNFKYFSEQIDPGFKTCNLLSKLTGRILLRLVDDTFLPLDIEDQAKNIEKEISTLRESEEWKTGVQNFTVEQAEVINDAYDILERSASAFKNAGHSSSSKRVELQDTNEQSAHFETRVRSYNDKVQYAERGFVSAGGLPGRTWYKHVISAPGRDLGYGFEVFPGVREALRASANRYTLLNNALADLTESIDASTSLVSGEMSGRNTQTE